MNENCLTPSQKELLDSIRREIQHAVDPFVGEHSEIYPLEVSTLELDITLQEKSRSTPSVM